MGTRLYPITETPETLEALCGVAPGTHAALKLLQNQERAEKSDIQEAFEAAMSVGADLAPLRQLWLETDEQYYEAIQRHRDTAILDNFLVFGWGKLTSGCWALLNEWNRGNENPGYCGETKDQGKVADLLNEQYVALPDGITIESLEGLAWN